MSSLFVSWSGYATVPDTLSAELEVIWSTPITTGVTPEGKFIRSEGLVLSAGAMSLDGRIVFLGDRLGGQHPSQVILQDAEQAGPNAAVPLQLTMPDPPGPQFVGTWLHKWQRPNRNPTTLRLALGTRGEMWLGGSSNSYMGDFDSTHHCDAYVAKLDDTGKPVWERTYGGGVCRPIESIVPAAGGGAVAVGRDRNASWLARIAPDGTLLGEHSLGNGKGAVAVPLADDRTLVAAFEGQGKAETYGYVVSTWLLDKAGELHGPTRIRDTINEDTGAYYGRLGASAASDGAYIVSNWSNAFRPKPVEVVHVGADNHLLWRRDLPDTISAEQGRTTFNTCDPALATLPNGDALVACALNGDIQLYRFSRDSGARKTTRLPLPECQRAHPAALFLMVRSDGRVFLGGSRPGGNVRENCSWLGRLVMRLN